jgi:hypothetical protein
VFTLTLAKTKQMKKNSELIANIILICVGIIFGSIFFIKEQKDLSLIFFAIALASILYQFLGGIGDSNNFNLGAIKFGGAAAILLGFMYFLKTVAFIPTPDSNYLNISENNWIPISTETGKIISVTISNGKDSRVFPDPQFKTKRASHVLEVREDDSGFFRVNAMGQQAEPMGYFEISNLKTSTLFNDIEIDDKEKRIKIFELDPDDNNKNSTKDFEELTLPFEIKVFNKSLFSILVDGHPLIENSEVVPRTAYLIPISADQSYIVFLEQASNEITENYPRRYSKWLVKKISLELLFTKKHAIMKPE